MLTFTQMGAITDQGAVEACVASGMIVVVEIWRGEIAGIRSAHTSTMEAYKAFMNTLVCDDIGVVVPQETGPILLTNIGSFEEFKAATLR